MIARWAPWTLAHDNTQAEIPRGWQAWQQEYTPVMLSSVPSPRGGMTVQQLGFEITHNRPTLKSSYTAGSMNWTMLNLANLAKQFLPTMYFTQAVSFGKHTTPVSTSVHLLESWNRHAWSWHLGTAGLVIFALIHSNKVQITSGGYSEAEPSRLYTILPTPINSMSFMGHATDWLPVSRILVEKRPRASTMWN